MSTQTHKQIFSLKTVRLASRLGPIVIVEARTPTSIPEALFLEAAKHGCVDYSEEMVAALKAAAAEATKQASVEEQPTAPDFLAMAKEAVRSVMAMATREPDLLSATGMPRLPAVRKAFDTLCSQQRVKADLKITSDLIAVIVAQIQDETTPAETGDRYPTGTPAGDLEGEEVGGVDLERLEDLDTEE